MRAGYSFEAYQTLCAAKNRLDERRKKELPFVSVAGPKFESAPLRILFVGKSTRANWRETHALGTLEEYESSVRWSYDWLERQALPSSAFWRFTHDVVSAVLPGMSGAPTSYIAWSNLAKIAQLQRCGPDPASATTMHEAEFAVLNAELEQFSPHLVVLVSNDAVWDVATKVFGVRSDMQIDSDGTWRRHHPKGFRLYWTRYPQGAPLASASTHCDRIAQFVGQSG